MTPTSRRIGNALIAFAEQLPPPEVHLADAECEVAVSDAATAAPFAQRMRALLARMEGGARPAVNEAVRVLRDAAPTIHLRHGPSDFVASDALAAAVRHGLIECDEWDDDGAPAPWSTMASLGPGVRAHLLADDPVAAVVEPWIGEMLRDAVADLDCDPRLRGPWERVPFLVVQVLDRAGDIRLADVADTIRREAGPLLRNSRLPWPLHKAVVGLVMGICVEYGVAEWDGDMRHPGHGRCTPLGHTAARMLRAFVESGPPLGATA